MARRPTIIAAAGGPDATTGGNREGDNSDSGPRIITIDPASVDAPGVGNGDGSGGGSSDGGPAGSGGRTRRKYTRRATSGGKAQTLPLDVLSGILLSSHAMLAGITRTAELAIAPEEADTLARALSTVNAFYDVKVAEKTLAWVNLAMVAGTIYGTRLVAIRVRRGNERAARAATQPQPQVYTAETVAPTSTAETPDVEFFMPGGGNFPGMGGLN